jgi:ketosteroid isomerase-like protein
VRNGHRELFRAMPDLKFQPRAWVVEGDKVAVLFVARAEKLGQAGRDFADFFTVKDGRIVRDVTIFNAGRPCR